MSKPRKSVTHLASGGKIIHESRYVPPPRPQVHHHHVSRESCFPATAQVLTPVGYRRMIDLHPGDRVMSFSQSSGKLIERYVTRRLEHGAQRLWQIRIVGVDEPLLTTPCHRFLTDRGWMQAREMRTGEKVHFIEENKVSHSEVVASKVSDQMAPVYNLYTSGEHNVVVDRMVAHNFVHFARLRTVFHNWFVDPAFDGLRPVTA